MSYTGPSLDCQFLQGDIVAHKRDCLEAISQLQNRGTGQFQHLGKTYCSVLSNATQSGGQSTTVLAHAGTCSISIGVQEGQSTRDPSLPTAKVVTYASNVVSACQDLQGATEPNRTE